MRQRNRIGSKIAFLTSLQVLSCGATIRLREGEATAGEGIPAAGARSGKQNVNAPDNI